MAGTHLLTNLIPEFMDCWNAEKSHLGEWGDEGDFPDLDLSQIFTSWISTRADLAERALEPQSAVAEVRFGQISLKRNSPNLTL